MKIISYILFLLCSSALIGQTVLIKETVPEDFSTTDANYGPNRSYFEYPYLNIGWKGDIYRYKPENQLSISSFRSVDLEFGTHYLIKINSFLGIVMQGNIGYQQYRLSNNNSYFLIDTTASYKSSKFQVFTIGSGFQFRFNLKPKRGNILGKYIDLGGFIDWNWGRRFKTYYKSGTGNYTVTANKLKSFQKYAYGFKAQYAGGIFGIFINYRMSDLLLPSSQQVDLPRTTIGLSIFMSEI